MGNVWLMYGITWLIYGFSMDAPGNPRVNLVGGDWNMTFTFPFSWEFHNPN